jgi:hypothetical protein
MATVVVWLLCCRWDEPMEVPSGAAAADVGVGLWQPGMTFGQFAELTVQKYYKGAQ